jgi:hypothetical protein
MSTSAVSKSRHERYMVRTSNSLGYNFSAVDLVHEFSRPHAILMWLLRRLSAIMRWCCKFYSYSQLIRFVTFNSEADARQAVYAIRNKRFNGNPIKARLKTETMNRAFYRLVCIRFHFDIMHSKLQEASRLIATAFLYSNVRTYELPIIASMCTLQWGEQQ